MLRASIFKHAALDYALVGRWLGHLVQGRLGHEQIAASPPVPGERAVGWAAHYTVGIALAGVLLAITGPAWVEAPTPGPALGVGVASVILPYAILQPGMGAGFAASRMPDPVAARMNTFLTHTVFGAGLYLAALVLKTCQLL